MPGRKTQEQIDISGCFQDISDYFRENKALLYLITSQCVNQMSCLPGKIARKKQKHPSEFH